ncbi:hypothetical protein ACFX5K_01725 [Rickettsiales bacterium LUAb2]
MKKLSYLIILITLLSPVSVIAKANSGFTTSLGLGGTSIHNYSTSSKYIGAKSFLSFDFLLGYQQKLSDSWALGIESGVIGSYGEITDKVTSEGINFGDVGNYFENVYTTRDSIPLLLKATYYVTDSGFNIFGKAGFSYNHITTHGDEVYSLGGDLKHTKKYEKTYISVTPLVDAGIGYQFDSGIGVALEGMYSFGKAANKVENRDNISNYSAFLNITYLLK